MVRNMAEVDLLDGFTGFGLYDKKIIEILKGIDDPYPYFRGLILRLLWNIAPGWAPLTNKTTLTWTATK